MRVGQTFYPYPVQLGKNTDGSSGYLNYPSVSDLLQSILSRNPQVVAFGEIHPQSEDPETTLSIFNNSLLPLLAGSGITELIVEMIYSSPEIEADIDKFYETGVLSQEATPHLYSNLSHYFDKDTFIALFNKARELGIRIHPGGVSPETATVTLLQPDYNDREDLQDIARPEANRNTLDQARQLLRRHRRIAIYSGLKHNDINPSRRDLARSANYGRALSGLVGSGYYAVDLVLPYGLESNPSRIQTPDPLDNIPQTGVNVYKDGNSYTVLFPRQ